MEQIPDLFGPLSGRKTGPGCASSTKPQKITEDNSNICPNLNMGERGHGISQRIKFGFDWGHFLIYSGGDVICVFGFDPERRYKRGIGRRFFFSFLGIYID